MPHNLVRLTFCFAVLLAGCAGSTAGLSARREVLVETAQVDGEPVRFEYFGVGGWIMRRGPIAIITPPLFSNPSLWRVAGMPLRSNERVVDEHVSRMDLRGVAGVLVGHSHYDHLLDVPRLMHHLPINVCVYGDETMTFTLPVGTRATSVLLDAGTRSRPGRWTVLGAVRFLPLLSSHAPHFHGLKAFAGNRRQPVVPRRATDWREGETLAYLIDFLREDGGIAFRVYYDDAAHGFPTGMPDDSTLADRRVDVAILCAASFHEVEGYPGELLAAMRPRHVLIGHWENFFQSPDLQPRTVPLTNVREFTRLVATAVGTEAWSLLLPQGTITFEPKTAPATK